MLPKEDCGEATIILRFKLLYFVLQKIRLCVLRTIVLFHFVW